MTISLYFVCFIIFSFFGWIYESIYCTVRTHHWDNRGFLFGPICPIYGVGGIAASFVFSVLIKHEAGVFQIFLISMLGSAVLEYVTAAILEKLFHASWWDYSSMPFNIKGRVCLTASVGFGLAGILVVKYISPFVFGLFDNMSPTAVELLSLILMAIFAADLALTVSGLTEIVKKIESIEEEFNERMEASYQIIEEGRQMVAEKMAEYERITTDKIREYAVTMSRKQQHSLRNIRKFSSKGTTVIADRIKEAVNMLPGVDKIMKSGENLDEKQG